MKEVTYEDWQKNPTPREMWVWDDYEEDKKKLKVIYFSKEKQSIEKRWKVIDLGFNSPCKLDLCISIGRVLDGRRHNVNPLE